MRPFQRAPRFVVTMLAVALAAASATAGVDVEIGNGNRVDGTLSPGSETETIRIVVPKGALLSVSAKGRKVKGASGLPATTFRLFDPNGNEVGASAIRVQGAGAKLSKFPVALSGEHRIEVRGDGTPGDYQLSVKWASPRKFTAAPTFATGDVPVRFACDEGAVASFTAKAARGSAARPQALEVRDPDGVPVVALPAPAAGATSHSVKKVALAVGGDLDLIVRDTSGDGGDVAVAITLKPPAASKAVIGLTSRNVDAGGSVVGKVIGPGGGIVSAKPIAAIDLAGVDVPAGALAAPTAILVGTGPEFTFEGKSAAGPSVFFGPEGASFDAAHPVTITVPFDAATYGADGAELVLLTRDAQGRVTEVAGRTVDVGAGTISAEVTHFSSFKAFGKPARPALPQPTADLNGDGIDDLVIPAPEEYATDRGRVFVYFGGPGLATGTTADADLVFSGVAGNDDEFGAAVATGDLNGDGRGDLVISSPAGSNGRVYVFFGGPSIASRTSAEADVTLTGFDSDSGEGPALAVGDLNGDAKDDLVIGADDVNSAAGRVHVFFGGSAFAGGTSANADATFTGESAGNRFGWSLATGDVTGDGVRDLVVGAQDLDNDGTGAAYVFRGGASFSGMSAASAPFKFTGEVAGDAFGWAVTTADVVAGGAVALVVGAPFHRGAGAHGDAAVYVFHGGPNFASESAQQADITIRGVGPSNTFGADLAAGDVDDDGDEELIVAAGGDDTAAFNAGAVIVLGAGVPIVDGTYADGAMFGGETQSTIMGDVLRPVACFGGTARAIIFAATRDDELAVNGGAVYVVSGAGGLPDYADADALGITIRGTANNTFLGGRP